MTLSLLVLSRSVHRHASEQWQQLLQHDSEWWRQQRVEDRRRDAEFDRRVREGRGWVEGRSVSDPADFETSYPAQPTRDWGVGQAPAPQYENLQTGPARFGTLLELPQGWLIGGVSSLVVGVILIAIGNVWK